MTLGTSALVGGTMIDVRTGATSPDSTVIISGDRVSEVGPAAHVRVPPGAAHVDVRGAWLVPGLTDMHVHVRTPSLLPVYLAFGVTTIRDVGGSLARGELLKRELAAGQRIGPRLFIVGPILDGIPPLWPDMTILVDTPPTAEAAVRFLGAHFVDAIKVYNSVPERSLATIVMTAHELGLRVTGHVPRSLTMSRAVELGMDGLEHIRVTAREMLPADEAARLDYLPLRRREALLWDRFDVSWPRFEALVTRLATAGVFLDPTFIADASPLRTMEERVHAESMAHLPPWIGETVREAAAARAAADVRRVMDVPPELLETSRAGFRKRQRFVGMCAAAGVRIVTGTDHTGPGEDLPGRGVQRELGFLVECGLTPLAALQASTINAASALGRERELGSIEPGKLADILVLDADPLVDIRHVASIRRIIHGGRVTTPAELLAASPTEPERPYAA